MTDPRPKRAGLGALLPSRVNAALLSAWLAGPGGLLALALCVGVGAGLGAIVFRELIVAFTYVFTGHADYGANGHVINPLAPGLGIWFVALVPIVGGLLYGPLVDRFAREARGHGVPEVMLAVSNHGGRIRSAVALVKSAASALCIGSGGSVGREGPIVQIGSALGSTLGQVARVPESRMRLLVACGAAGGISATFNAPIAGVFFALEVILCDFETRSFGAVVLASVTADVIGRAAFGAQAFLALPQLGVGPVAGYPLYVVLGLLAAAVGTGFIRVLYGMEDRADRLWRFSEAWRPAAGGLLLGLLLLALPQMYGVGYPVLEGAIDGRYALLFLLILLAGKVIATSLTLSIGGSGGVFAPSLFMGAMLGSAFGLAANDLLPSVAGPPGAYGLIGMGAVFAATGRAPMTAILIIFELTGDYRIMLPLMLAVVLATALANRLSPDSIYTLKLRRRGIDLRRGFAESPMHTLTVAQAMRPMPEAADAGSLVRRLPILRADDSLAEATGTLAQTDSSGLAVLDPDGVRIVGWLSHRDILCIYDQHLKQQRTGSPAGANAPA